MKFVMPDAKTLTRKAFVIVVLFLLSLGFCFLIWLFLNTKIVGWLPLPLKTSIFASLLLALVGARFFKFVKAVRLLVLFISALLVGAIIFYYLVASSL